LPLLVALAQDVLLDGVFRNQPAAGLRSAAMRRWLARARQSEPRGRHLTRPADEITLDSITAALHTVALRTAA
jgi:hypothetical protein